MTKQLECNSSESDCDQLADEIPFVGDILQQIQFEFILTAVELQGKKPTKNTTNNNNNLSW